MHRPLSLFALFAIASVTVGCLHPDPLSTTPGLPVGPFAVYDQAEEPVPVIPARWPEQGRFTLARCIELALHHNPRTSISWHSVLASAAQLGQQRSRYLPQAELSATGQRRKYQDLAGIEEAVKTETYDASVTVTQLLLDGGVRSANVNAAEAALRASAFRHNVELLDVALEVEENYYNLLAATSLLNVAEDTVDQRTRQWELATRLHQGGLARQVEELQAKAELADAESARVGARNQVRIARGRLASSMGLSVNYPLQIVEIPLGDAAPRRSGVESLIEAGTQNRPGLKAAVAQLASIREQLKAEKGSRWPRLEARASYGYNDTHLLFEDRNEWSAALVLNLPIFTGFQTTYRIKQVEEQLRNGIASYERLLRNVELEVWEAYSNVVRAEEAIRAADEFLRSALESRRAVERAYENGRATIVELIDAQTAVTRAQNRQVNARLGWRLAVARLERAVGRAWDPVEGTSDGAAENAATTVDTYAGEIEEAAQTP